MDPASIVSLVGAASSLAFKCGKLVQTLYELAERYKQAELSILSIIQECRTIELAWSRIERWAANGLNQYDDYEQLGERIQLSLYSSQLVISELEKDLASLSNVPQNSSFRRRSKFLWNEKLLLEHQNRIRGQVCAITFLLEVIRLPSRSDRAELLSIREPVFRNADESVRSIVPSRLSACSDAASIKSIESGELWYIPFAFENDLFTSYVYKRNFRVPKIRNVSHKAQKEPSTHMQGPSSAVIETGDTSSHHCASGVIDTHDPSARKPQNEPLLPSSGFRTADTSDTSPLLFEAPLDSPTPSSIDPLWTGQWPMRPNSVRVSTGTSNEDGDVSRVAIPTDPPISTEKPVMIANNISPHSGHPATRALHIPMSIKRKPLSSSAQLHLQKSIRPTTTASIKALRTETARYPQAQEPRSPFLTCCRHQFLEKGVEPLDYATLETPQGGSELAMQCFGEAEINSLFSPFACAGCNFTSSQTATILHKLHKQDRQIFSILLQTVALTFGGAVVNNLTYSLRMAADRITELEDDSNDESSIEGLHWTDDIVKNPLVVYAATYRDEAASSGILSYYPTALQLACVTKNCDVVECLLKMGRPAIPSDWTSDPFILATKRRCRPILELFFRLAENSVSTTIRNIALMMVVNQDCALSEKYMDRDQNDRKRIGEDINIVSLLLANGAAPNARDKHGVSMLSLAIKAAGSSNRHSLQIVDILIGKGASFGDEEQRAVALSSCRNELEDIVRRRGLFFFESYYFQ